MTSFHFFTRSIEMVERLQFRTPAASTAMFEMKWSGIRSHRLRDF